MGPWTTGHNNIMIVIANMYMGMGLSHGNYRYIHLVKGKIKLFGPIGNMHVE